MSSLQIFKHPLTNKSIEVADQDIEQQLSWNDAVEACAALKNGWRLPTFEEFKAMFEQLDCLQNGNFITSTYWTATEYDEKYAWVFSVRHKCGYTNGVKLNHYNVRAVRDK
jgi:hypothetical protein